MNSVCHGAAKWQACESWSLLERGTVWGPKGRRDGRNAIAGLQLPLLSAAWTWTSVPGATLQRERGRCSEQRPCAAGGSSQNKLLADPLCLCLSMQVSAHFTDTNRGNERKTYVHLKNSSKCHF